MMLVVRTLAVVVCLLAPLAGARASTLVTTVSLSPGQTDIVGVPHSTPGSTIDDQIDINVSNGPVTGLITITNVANGGFLNANISGVTLTDDLSNVLGTGLTIAFSGLANGLYHLFVTGTATGQFGGYYVAAISAVPLPASLTLLLSALGGLLLLGLVHRRKSVA